MSFGENFNAEGIDEQYEAFMAADPESYRIPQYETSTKAETPLSDEHTYFTRKEVAELLKVRPQTVDMWITREQLGSTDFGNKHSLISLADIKAFGIRREAK